MSAWIRDLEKKCGQIFQEQLEKDGGGSTKQEVDRDKWPIFGRGDKA